MLGATFVGNGSKKGKKEKCKNVVKCHNNTGYALGHSEFVRQYLGYNCIVCLPKADDEEKGKAYEHCSAVIKLHYLYLYLSQ